MAKQNLVRSPIGLSSLAKKRNLGGDDVEISSAFTSAKNLVIFRRPLVMQNPQGVDGKRETLLLSSFLGIEAKFRPQNGC